MGDLPSPLKIRAHHLLCLQGFQGLGYSEEFIAQMSRVHRHLRLNPGTEIQVLIGADVICEHCPHHYRGRCTINDPEDQPISLDTPDQAVLRDRRVLSWLELKDGMGQLWGQVLYKIGRLVDSTAMSALCIECRWSDEGLCATALDDLNEKVTGGELLFAAKKSEIDEPETADSTDSSGAEIPDSTDGNNSEPVDSSLDRT